jgi:cell division protease FtsH
LIEKEVITSEDVEAILGARPWTSRTDEIIEANEASKAKRLEGEEAKGEKKKRAPRKKKEVEQPQETEAPTGSPVNETPAAENETI